MLLKSLLRIKRTAAGTTKKALLLRSRVILLSMGFEGFFCVKRTSTCGARETLLLSHGINSFLL